MKSILFFLLLAAGYSMQAQDITGIWRGSFRPAASATRFDWNGATAKYKFEVQLDQQNKQFSGVTYSYLTTVFYGKATCEGTINPVTKKVRLEELKIVEIRMAGGEACIMTLMMQYSKVDNEEILEGTYTSYNIEDSTNCGRGTVFLRKVTTSDFYEEPFLVEREKEKAAVRKTVDSAIAKKTASIVKAKPPVKKPAPVIAKATAKANTNKPPVTPKPNNNNSTALKKPVTKPVVKPPVKQPVKQPQVIASKPDVKIIPTDTGRKIEIKSSPAIAIPKVLANRENELVKTITTDASEIVINIYDNGAIDNDTISVYLDKKLVLSKQRLTDKALTLKFRLDDNADYHELVMVAENLGEIPPNTSLMVVNAGNKQYEVRITSTEQKNAVVIFKLNR